MGYTTTFVGSIQIDPPLNSHEVSFLHDFNESRHMYRTKGPLYVKGSGTYGQGQDEDIIDFNNPHPDQPGLWCSWTVDFDGTEIHWDGSEKFYDADKWMEYLLKKLLSEEARSYVSDHLHEDARLQHFTCNHNFSGRIEAQGEDESDKWAIEVETI